MANNNGNGNGKVEIGLFYNDVSVAIAELDGLVRFALFDEQEHKPREPRPLSVPESATLGVLRFSYRNAYDRRDFLQALREDGRFHFNSVKFSPPYS